MIIVGRVTRRCIRRTAALTEVILICASESDSFQQRFEFGKVAYGIKCRMDCEQDQPVVAFLKSFFQPVHSHCAIPKTGKDQCNMIGGDVSLFRPID